MSLPALGGSASFGIKGREEQPGDVRIAGEQSRQSPSLDATLGIRAPADVTHGCHEFVVAEPLLDQPRVLEVRLT